MKRIIKIGLVLISVSCFGVVQTKAQSIADDLEQLSLDYQKLAGLKQILQQMYSGYQVLSKGYNSVRDASQGNFSLHEAFLDGLMLVSPTVRKYPRVADIINDQAVLVSEYKTASAAARQSGHFSPDEVGYMMDVYNNLVSTSLRNLDDLAMVITDSKLRMSDAERLGMIDRLYEESKSQLSYLRSFNNRLYQTSLLRTQQIQDKSSVKSLYGLNP